MSKRKGKAISGATAAKRVTAEGIDAPDDANYESPSSSGSSHFATEEVGLIESITVKNFMCHELLSLQFGPNVNFIVGSNGSGKSAILTALIVGLGGKATFTNRAAALKDFVKTGEKNADITVKLRNRGPDAYRRDVYGDCISIEQRISCDGNRTCKMRSKSGHVISNKKEELTNILENFNIQLDNPVSILNQEMSKQFLHSKKESDKYKFFMKATLLEQMKLDYIHIKQTKSVTEHQVERQEECLKDLKQEYLQKKERYDSLSRLSEMRDTLESLTKSMAWCLVGEKEQFVQQLKEDLEKEESDYSHQDNLQRWQTRVTGVEKKLQSVKSRVDSLNEEQERLSGDNLKLKERMKMIKKAHKEQEALNKLRQSEKEQSLLQEKINKAKTSPDNDREAEYTQRQKEISDLRGQLAEFERAHSQLDEEIESKHQALLKQKEERDELRLEERSTQSSFASKLRRKNQLLASRSNRLRRFGDGVPDLLRSIDEAFAAGRFRKKPLGPLGVFISLRDPALAVAVECCLGALMKAFCCDNYQDEAVLQQLMSPCYPQQGHRPQIIVSCFSERVHNTAGRRAYHPEHPSLLDTITVSNPVAMNCLVDTRRIEAILIIKEKDTARRVMQHERPKNSWEAFTLEGDQVFPDRYYSQDKNTTAKYLGGDIETEIRVLEADLENLQAQLSGFQVRVTSLSEDIRSTERQLNSTTVTLRENLTSMNQVKAAISELEAAAEEQIDDISSLEEVARENRQKIETEKQTVHEAKTELDKLLKKAEDLEPECSSVRERIDQLPEDVELLKDEELKLEAELAKHERYLNISEDKLKTHENNIQAMRSDLAQREEELQEAVAKATEISPERQPATGCAKSIDAEITRLKKKIEVHERSHGRREEVVREYTEALHLYSQKKQQMKNLWRFISRLNQILSDRLDRYQVTRRSLSFRCKLFFNSFMAKMNCCGSLIFDHNNETLSVSVTPPGRDDDGVKDMRSLSGGERSFSTVCFMLSLWEITDSPFRCLDEFDVYMDMDNRRKSLALLLQLSEGQRHRQFIFITPLTTSNLPESRRIKIHRLQDPERDQSDTGDEGV